MKTLHVVPSLDQGMGGSIQAALSMCSALRGAGIESVIAATASADDRLSYLEDEFPDLRTEVHPRRPPRHYFRSPALRRRIREMTPKVDVIHVHGVFNFPAAYALSVNPGRTTRVVLSPHGQLDPYDLATHAAGKRLYGEVFLRRAFHRVGRVLVTSEREGDALETYRVPLKIETIPLPVENTVEGCGSRLRQRYQIPLAAPLILFLGRIHPKKRVDILLKSTARIRSDVPDLRLLLVGDGERRYTGKMRELAAQLDLTDAVTWTGILRGSAKADAFAAANVFALPSENENFGITVAEALCAGLPTLVSTEVHIQETIGRHALGAVCEPDVESCSRQLLELLRDPDRLDSASRRARDVAASLFSPTAVGEQLGELYRTVLEESP